MIVLYDYVRSSAAFRVRIALNLKKIAYRLHEVHLVNNGGEQHHAAYQRINPQGLVPTLVDGAITITQSMAILEYLDAQYPNAALLTDNIELNARIRAVANIIACDIHPLNNLRVLNYLKNNIQISDAQKTDWYAHWIALGFSSIESLIDAQHGFCFSNRATMADVCLIPQVYNAYRFECDLSPYPNIVAVYKNCMQQDAFHKAAPADWRELLKEPS